MVEMIKKTEAYFMKEFAEKAGKIAILSLFILIPNFGGSMFFIFLFVTGLLASDIHNKRFSTLITLPYSYKEIFFMSYFFMISLITLLTTVSIGLYGFSSYEITLSYAAITLLKSLIFATAYFSISMICVSFGLDNFITPLFILIADLILGGIGRTWQINPYKAISPVHQEIIWASLIFSVILLIIAVIQFDKKGVQK